MSMRIKIAVLAAAIAFVSPGPTASHGDRNNNGGFKVAQYCMPENDLPIAQNGIYC
jgi:hypothetical protein